jgi:3-deoxy-D-manno-octulosonate 8-phosphate phosphatase (KDO 8-P phosphatase)
VIDPAALAHKAAAIRLISFDVDGVLTDGAIIYTDDGREIKSFNVQDGAAIKLLMSHGVEVALLTGRSSPMVERRAAASVGTFRFRSHRWPTWGTTPRI